MHSYTIYDCEVFLAHPLDSCELPHLHLTLLVLSSTARLAPKFDAMMMALEHRYYGGAAFDGVQNLRWHVGTSETPASPLQRFMLG